MTKLEFTQKIKRFALDEAGFDLAKISPASLPDAHGAALKSWVGAGYAGTMGYMTREPEKRANPQAVLPGAKSVLVLALNYFHPEDPKPSSGRQGKVAKYAYGRDYHKIITKKLRQVCRFIGELGAEAKSYVDTGPVLERALAKESGMGFFGKNTNIITREYGSWVFLASILCTLELIPDEPHTGSCGTCRICIDACPTQALLGDYRLDARKCISYLTIENKSDYPEELKAGIGEWSFGCDVCQDVCPYNFRKKVTRHLDLYPQKKAGTWLDLEALETMSDAEFDKKFEGSPIRRAKRQGLLRGLLK